MAGRDGDLSGGSKRYNYSIFKLYIFKLRGFHAFLEKRKNAAQKVAQAGYSVIMHSLIWYGMADASATTRFRFNAPFTVNPRTQLDTLYTTQCVLEQLNRARRQTAPPLNGVHDDLHSVNQPASDMPRAINQRINQPQQNIRAWVRNEPAQRCDHAVL